MYRVNSLTYNNVHFKGKINCCLYLEYNIKKKFMIEINSVYFIYIFAVFSQNYTEKVEIFVYPNNK